MHAAASLLHRSQQLLVPIAAAKRAAPRSAGGNAELFCPKTTASLGFRPNLEHRELLLSGLRLATSEAR